MKNKKNSENKFVTILVVEDSPTQSEQLKYILEQHSYKVKVAKDGKKALMLIAENKPSLVISDIVMPEMNGYELCEVIKSDESTTNIPVILLTSLSSSEDVLEGIACGADNFLTKPYDEDYLLSHIEQILANTKVYKSEKVRVGVEILFGGKKRFITASQQQMLTLLISTYEAAVNKNSELLRIQNELKSLNEHLEELVTERTTELSEEIIIRKQTEERVIKLNRIYALLSNINQTIVRVHDTKQLLNDACQIAIKEGKFQSAWIGIINNETKKIETTASAGLTNDLVKASPDQSPILNVIKTGKYFISNNINTDNNIFGNWKQNSLSLGLKSFAMLPLIVLEKVVGGFCICSNEVNFFDNQEISLLDEMATDISFALEYIQKDAERKQVEKQLKQKTEEIETQNEEYKQINEEYKQINEELYKSKIKAEESDKLKSAFLANMSHEIRTPMNGIVGFADLLNNPSLSDKKKREFTAIIIERSNQLLNIVSDILDISKIEAGLVTVKNECVAINNLINELWTFYSNQAKLKNIHFDKKFGLDGLQKYISADKTKITQILNNLLNNALKFTCHGHIVFGYELKGEMLEFYIEDTGIGIPDEYKEKIFERFRQVEHELTKNYGGTGLGLSISKELIEMMGGKIWIKSELGVGTKVFFTIPYVPLNSETEFIHESAKSITDKNIEGKSILIVDDDEINLLYLKELISEFRLKIFEATNGIEAVEKFKNNREISLVLMDLKMPIMNGIEATKLIKSMNSTTKIVAQTAYAMYSEKEMAIKEGCDDYISKPLNKQKLIDLVKKYL